MEIVRSIYEALNRGDWDAVFHNADRDFALTTQVGPAAGTHRGRKEVVAFLEDFRGMFDRLTWEPEEFFDGEDRVVAFVKVCSRPRVAASTSWSGTDTSGRFTMGSFPRWRPFPTEKTPSKPPGCRSSAMLALHASP